jgi:hypothetical protein
MTPAIDTPDRAPLPFVHTVAGFGAIRISRFLLDDDAPALHDWVNRPYAAFWGMRGKTLAEVKAKYADIQAGTAHEAAHEVLIGRLVSTGERIFLLECYRPEQDLLGRYYSVQSGDRGFHLLMAPAQTPAPGLTYHAVAAMNAYLFRDPAVQRIVAEPDIRNTKMFERCLQAGYALGKVVHLPHKTAQLIMLTRERFAALADRQAPPRPRLPLRALRVKAHLLLGRVIRKLAATPQR